MAQAPQMEQAQQDNPLDVGTVAAQVEAAIGHGRLGDVIEALATRLHRGAGVASGVGLAREMAWKHHDMAIGGPAVERLTLGNIGDAFTYQAWERSQAEQGDQVREALVAAAKTILRNVPETPLRTRALNCLIDARMLANAAITFR